MLMAKSESNPSGVVSRIVPRAVLAPALTSTWIAPKTALRFRRQATAILDTAEVAPKEQHGRATIALDRLRGRLAFRLVPARGHEACRTRLGEPARDRRAEALRRSRDDANSSDHSVHGHPFSTL